MKNKLRFYNIQAESDAFSDLTKVKANTVFYLTDEELNKVDWDIALSTDFEIDLPEKNELKKYSDEEISKEYLKRNNKFVFCPYCGEKHKE